MDIKSKYQILSEKILQRDALLWQAPGLSLTAQAFLFTISLGDSSPLARLIASGLSIVISLLSIQLMLKHRKLSDLDIDLLEKYEKQLNKTTKHTASRGPFFRSKQHPLFSLEWFKSSINVWIVGLSLFGLAAVLVFFLTIFSPTVLSTPEPFRIPWIKIA